jgi:hypothetical protein
MGEQQKSTTDRSRTEAKKPYRAPRLTVYGDLRTITKAKGGTKGDGGSQTPNTKQ